MSTCLFSLDCKALVIPTDGSLDTTDVKEGTIVTTTCNTGYTLIGLSTVECLPRGKWNRYLPFCHRGRIIRIYHDFVNKIDKNVTNVIVWHHEAETMTLGADLSIISSNLFWILFLAYFWVAALK